MKPQAFGHGYDTKTPFHMMSQSIVSIFIVIRPAICTDIQPPRERGELTIIGL